MNVQFFLPNGKSLAFIHQIPANMAKHRISCHQVYSCSYDFGQVFIQEIVSLNFTICYCIFQILENIILDIDINQPVLQAHLMLQGEIPFRTPDCLELILFEEFFMMGFAPFVKTSASFKKGKEYIFLSLYYDSSCMQALLPYFPQFKEFNEKVDKLELALVSSSPRRIMAESRHIVEQILNFSYEDIFLKPYVEMQGRGLLLLLIREQIKNVNKQESSMIQEQDLDILREMMGSDLKYFPEMAALSRKSGMSESKLRKDFKNLYGVSLKKYWQQQRMLKAKDLLSEQPFKTIKQIAQLLGYDYENSFIKAFGKAFGISPDEWRRKHNHEH